MIAPADLQSAGGILPADCKSAGAIGASVKNEKVRKVI